MKNIRASCRRCHKVEVEPRPGSSQRILHMAVAAFSVNIMLLSGFAWTSDTALPADELACRNRIYVANNQWQVPVKSREETLSVIDTETNKIIADIPMKGPYNPTISPDGRYVYVTTGTTGEVAVVDVRTNTIKSTLPTGAHSTGLAITTDGDRLLVTLGGETIEHTGNVRVVNLETGKISKPIPVGRTPERIAVSPNGKRAYVLSRDMALAVIDVPKEEVIASIPLIANAFSILISPGGDKIYAAHHRDKGGVSVIDTASNQVESHIEIEGGALGLVFSRDYRSLYITNNTDSTIQEVSFEQGKVIRRGKLSEQPGLLSLSADGRYAYVAYSRGKDIAVIDTSTLAEVAKITTGAPTSLAVCGSP